jgi:head-tail adaptor
VTLTSLLVHDVTILTAGTTTNRYGDAEKDWSDPTEETVKGWVSQSTQSEDHEQREAQVSDWVLYLHPDVTISGANRVQWEGITFEVEGPTRPAWTPRGVHHLEVPLRVVTG